MMKVEVVVPDEYMGDVMGDIASRRGRVTGMDMHAGMHTIGGIVPLSEMFGYATDLRSKTQGRGNYAMEPSHNSELPKSKTEELVKARGKD
jgi:elongation factor G